MGKTRPAVALTRDRGWTVKEETAEEKGLGKIIAGKLREQLGPESRPGECPDAETLACYFDYTLTEGEREAFDTHLLGCSRCQEHIAELVRLSGADEPRVMVADEAPVDIVEEPGAGWHFNLAWAGLALGVVVALGFWQRSRITNYFQPPSETAENVSPPAPETPSPAAKKIAALDQRARREAATAADQRPGASLSVGRVAAEEKTEGALGTKAADEFAKSKEAAPTTTLAQNAPPPESRRAAGGAAVAERGAIATPSQRAGRGAVVQPGGRSIEMQSEKPNLRLEDRDTAGTQLSAAAPQPSPAPAKVLARADQAETASSAPKMMVQGLTARYTPKWRVGRRGVIQKAEPNGNWVAVASGVDSDLFDITFAGSSAGWAVGHGGLVLRSTDGGNTWTRTTSPTTEDLLHVSATSELAARVITRRNILHSTSDGGNSWTSAPQQ